MKLLFIGVAGILGALSRYGLSLGFNPHEWTSLPVGTLLCNYAGCLALGMLSELKRLNRHPQLKAAVTTGFVGSFTTFSSFSAESVSLLQHGLWATALLYLLLSLWGGLGLAWLGGALMRRREVKTS